jgi:hypothetical protein
MLDIHAVLVSLEPSWRLLAKRWQLGFGVGEFNMHWRSIDRMFTYLNCPRGGFV